jgi:prepilin-type N-terminal cleavage/methylation domain-containing protein
MRDLVADEDGFTLVELLAALVVGTIVLFAAFGLLDTAVRLQAKSVDGLDATDRGRVGIDRISQDFASRICLGDQPSLVSADDAGVEFYASLAPESSAVRLIVQRRRLTVTGTAIRDDVWTASPPVAPPSLPPASTTTPTSTRMVVADIRRIGTTPIFRYYANQGTPARPTLLLATPLSAIDLSRAVLIDVSFAAQGKRADVSTDYRNQILNNSATCVS